MTFITADSGPELHVCSRGKSGRRIPTRANVRIIGCGADVLHCEPVLWASESVMALTAYSRLPPTGTP